MPFPAARPTPPRAARLALLLVGVLYLASFLLVEKRGFWVVDNANKFIQARALVASGFSRLDIPWPGAALDPGFVFNPLPPPFSRVSEGRLHSQYHLPFAFLSGGLYALLGWHGLYLLPLVGALGCLEGVRRLALALLGDRSKAAVAVALAGLATPVWFYSQTFWEHTVALCLAVWGVYWMTRFAQEPGAGRLAAGSALLAAGVYFRDDLYLLCLVAAAAAALRSPAGRLRTALTAAGVMAAVLAPLWLLEWKLAGNPLGFHLGANLPSLGSPGGYAASRLRASYNLFLAWGPRVSLSLLFCAPFVLAPLVGRSPSGRTRAVAPGLLCLAASASALFALGGYGLAGSRAGWMLGTNSLFPASPFLVAAMWPAREAGLRRWLSFTAWGHALLYALLSPEISTRGIHWGGRYLLILYPLLAVLASDNLVDWWRTRPGARSALVLVVAVSIAAQVYSLVLLDRKQAFSERLNEAIGHRSERVIVTDTWWAPQELHSVFFDKAVFYAGSGAAMERLVELIEEAGHKEFVLVSGRPREGMTPLGALRDEALGYFSLWFYGVSVTPSTER